MQLVFVLPALFAVVVSVPASFGLTAGTKVKRRMRRVLSAAVTAERERGKRQKKERGWREPGESLE